MDIRKFIEEWRELKAKLDILSYFPENSSKIGDEFYDINMEGDFIVYTTISYYQGERDYYSLTIKIDDLNQPVEFFVEKKKILDKEREVREAKERKEMEERQLKRDREKYEELKKKLGL